MIQSTDSDARNVQYLFDTSVISMYTVDHDSSAGYHGRIGYRYRTMVRVQLDSKVWSRLKKQRNIGSLVLDVGNYIYRKFGFTQTYSPSVDTKARARNGVVSVSFDYFHNSNEDAERMGYTGGFLKHHRQYEGKSDQHSLDPNNEVRESETKMLGPVDSKGLEVSIESVDGEVSEGAWVTEATYVESGLEVPDEELEYISDRYQDVVYDMYYQNLVAGAEAACEGDR